MTDQSARDVSPVRRRLRSGLEAAAQAGRRSARRAGFEVRRFPPSDVSSEALEIVRACSPYTATSLERLVALQEAVVHVSERSVPGAIVECGVWRGGSMMAAAMALAARGDFERDLHLFDTFDGMVEPTAADLRDDGRSASDLLRRTAKRSASVWMIAALDEVKGNMARTGYPVERVHFVEGRVEETLESRAPERVALARLDTDWYESTAQELRVLYPRISPGGVLVIDDYGYWQGARRAVDEYFATLDDPPFLHRIDDTGRVAVIPG